MAWTSSVKTMLKVIVAALGAGAALIAIIGYVTGLFSAKPLSKVQLEEKMVRDLIPGESYSRLSEVIKSSPNYEKKLPSGNRLYQYERPWETLQLVVSPVGKVLSVGMYAKSDKFRASIGIQLPKIVLNKTLISRAVAPFAPDRINLYCGARREGYIEAYDGLSNALEARALVVGVVGDEDTPGITPSLDCRMEISLAFSGQCGRHLVLNYVSACYAQHYLTSPQARLMRKNSVVSMVIATAPGYQKIIRDMLYPPSDVAGYP
jgi:hypothetical protein